MREPLPKELLIEAWKAIVGAERERCLTHRAWVCQQDNRSLVNCLEKQECLTIN